MATAADTKWASAYCAARRAEDAARISEINRRFAAAINLFAKTRDPADRRAAEKITDELGVDNG